MYSVVFLLCIILLYIGFTILLYIILLYCYIILSYISHFPLLICFTVNWNKYYVILMCCVEFYLRMVRRL